MKLKVKKYRCTIKQKIKSSKHFEKALGKCCALVEKEAKQKAPKDTGELRRSIKSEIRSKGDEIVGVVFTPLEYAPYVEFGTGLFAEEQGQALRWLHLRRLLRNRLTS